VLAVKVSVRFALLSPLLQPDIAAKRKIHTKTVAIDRKIAQQKGSISASKA
jgi:hypothetical protein